MRFIDLPFGFGFATIAVGVLVHAAGCDAGHDAATPSEPFVADHSKAHGGKTDGRPEGDGCFVDPGPIGTNLGTPAHAERGDSTCRNVAPPDRPSSASGSLVRADLVRAIRTPEELEKAFEPTAQVSRSGFHA